jgi:hypothetical protein
VLASCWIHDLPRKKRTFSAEEGEQPHAILALATHCETKIRGKKMADRMMGKIEKFDCSMNT